jgi:hypothetical protein
VSLLDHAPTHCRQRETKSTAFVESLCAVEQVAGDLENWVRWIRPGDRPPSHRMHMIPWLPRYVR